MHASRAVGGVNIRAPLTGLSSLNLRGWLVAGFTQTNSTFEEAPLILKNDKKYVTLSSLGKVVQATSTKGKQPKN